MACILESLDAWAERCPDQRLYAWLDERGEVRQAYTYREFVVRSTSIAAYLDERLSLEPGSRVLLAYPPGLEVICAFFACVRLGLVPVPVYPPGRHGFATALSRMDFIARDSGASAVLTDRAFSWSMKLERTRHRIGTRTRVDGPASRLPWLVTSGVRADTATRAPQRHSDLLFLQYTSGSTADPRGVMVTHANLIANCEAVVDHRAIGVSWLPQYHDMGLIGYYLFFAMKGGTTYGFSPMDFIRHPWLWLTTVSRYRCTASSAPNFAYEYCLRPGKIPKERREGLDLSSLRFLMNAAEPVRASVVRDFLREFEPYGLDSRSFFAAYGLAEHTLAVSNYGRDIRSYDRKAALDHVMRPAAPEAPDAETLDLVSCGRLLGETELAIVDTRACPRRLPARQVGEIWLRGPSNCSGYWNRPELSAKIFAATLPEDTEQGQWLRTGDLGFVDDDQLFICGRAKDLIVVRGQNYHPQDIERVLEREPTLRKGGVAAFSEETRAGEAVVVVAELREVARRPDVRTLAAALQAELGVGVRRFVFIRARTMPKTSSGKLMRHQVRARDLEGSLDVVATEPVAPDEVESSPGPLEPNTLDPIDALFARFGLTGTERAPVSELGLDSIQLVEFAERLEQQLGRRESRPGVRTVSLQVLQSIACCELRELLAELGGTQAQENSGLLRRFEAIAEDRRVQEAAAMRRDRSLRFDPGQLPSPEVSADRGRILLTGGTGFFGPFLLSSLLEQTEDDIAVLVRADSARDGQRRIERGLCELHGMSELPSRWAARLEAVPGDLARENLGLSRTTWDELARSVHAIYHNGAMVNYLYDYATMRDANVGGTNEIVRLAASHRPTVLNHLSTTFVFGWSVKDTLFEHDANEAMERLDFGYSQSKWVSEQVVFDAMKRGLPARVFRPALITPSVDGAGSHFDIAVRLLAFMLQHGLGTTPHNQVSFCPADVTANNIVAIAQQPASLGHTFHVTRDEYANMSDITALLGELTGTDFRQYALGDFVPEVIARCQPGDILFPLLEFFVKSTDNISAMEFKRYDNGNYRRFRDASPQGQADPSLREVVTGLLRFMRRKGLVAV